MATQLFKQNAILMAKIETTSGTDSIPDSSNNAVLVRNMSINPMEGNAVDLEYVRPWYGQDASLRVATYMTCQFDTDWVPGPGAAGTASPFDNLHHTQARVRHHGHYQPLPGHPGGNHRRHRQGPNPHGHRLGQHDQDCDHHAQMGRDPGRDQYL